MTTPDDPYAAPPGGAQPPAGPPPTSPPSPAAGWGTPPPPGQAPPGQAAPGQPGPGQAPGWGPPSGYGAPPGQPQWGGPAYGARPTNTLAIVSLVLIFTVTPAALVTGIIARRQIRQTGESGDGMALAGIICGALSIAFVVVIIIGAIALVAIGSGLDTGDSTVVPLRLILSGWA